MTNKANLFQVEGQHTGLLIAVWLDPELASSLAIEGGEAADQLHLTLCYCGDANEMSDVQIGRAIGAAAEAGMMFGPLTGQIAGLGRFNASESSDGKDVIYANVDVPGLVELRQFIASTLEYVAGVPPLRNHGYTPHITLDYIDPFDPMPFARLPTRPFTIRSIWIGVGDRRTEIPLSGEPYRADAYKAGARHNRRDTQMLQTMHDHAVTLGASCGTKATISAPFVPAPIAGTKGPVAGNALKALSKTDDELRVGNYMVLFNGRDLEGHFTRNVNADGSRGEFFTKSTKFDSPYTELGVLYVDWEHGMDDDGPGRDEPLGIVDWKSARIDDKGLFVERVLNRHNKYVKYVEELLDLGILGASSEAIAEQVERKANGEIEVWPLRRDTITAVPMDYRQKMAGNTLEALKALSQRVPALKTIVEQAGQSEPGASPEAASTAAADAGSKALLLELELLTLEMAL